MKWKKAPKKLKVDPVLLVPVVHICIKCHSRESDGAGERCWKCEKKRKDFLAKRAEDDKAYKEKYLKHKGLP